MSESIKYPRAGQVLGRIIDNSIYQANFANTFIPDERAFLNPRFPASTADRSESSDSEDPSFPDATYPHELVGGSHNAYPLGFAAQGGAGQGSERVGEWYGKDRRKLCVNKRFQNIVRDFESKYNKGTFEGFDGSLEQLNEFREVLRSALEAIGLEDKLVGLEPDDSIYNIHGKCSINNQRDIWYAPRFVLNNAQNENEGVDVFPGFDHYLRLLGGGYGILKGSGPRVDRFVTRKESIGIEWSSPQSAWKLLKEDAELKTKTIPDRFEDLPKNPLMYPSKDMTDGLRDKFKTVLQAAVDKFRRSYGLMKKTTETRRIRQVLANIRVDAEKAAVVLNEIFTRFVNHGKYASKNQEEAYNEFRNLFSAVSEYRAFVIVQLSAYEILFARGEEGLAQLVAAEDGYLLSLILQEQCWYELDNYRSKEVLAKTEHMDVVIRRMRLRKGLDKYWAMRRQKNAEHLKNWSENAGATVTEEEEKHKEQQRLYKEEEKKERVRRRERTHKRRELHKSQNRPPVQEPVETPDSKQSSSRASKATSTQQVAAQARDIVVGHLQEVRRHYEAEVDEVVKKNDALDESDPGNFADIHANNEAIQAGNNLIQALELKIAEALSSNGKSSGAGTLQTLPDLQMAFSNTKTIPLPKNLPTNITSYAPGNLPGNHPNVGIPRVLIGANGRDFGMDPLQSNTGDDTEETDADEGSGDPTDQGESYDEEPSGGDSTNVDQDQDQGQGDDSGVEITNFFGGISVPEHSLKKPEQPKEQPKNKAELDPWDALEVPEEYNTWLHEQFPSSRDRRAQWIRVFSHTWPKLESREFNPPIAGWTYETFRERERPTHPDRKVEVYMNEFVKAQVLKIKAEGTGWTVAAIKDGWNILKPKVKRHFHDYMIAIARFFNNLREFEDEPVKPAYLQEQEAHMKKPPPKKRPYDPRKPQVPGSRTGPSPIPPPGAKTPPPVPQTRAWNTKELEHLKFEEFYNTLPEEQRKLIPVNEAKASARIIRGTIGKIGAKYAKPLAPPKISPIPNTYLSKIQPPTPPKRPREQPSGQSKRQKVEDKPGHPKQWTWSQWDENKGNYERFVNALPPTERDDALDSYHEWREDALDRLMKEHDAKASEAPAIEIIPPSPEKKSTGAAPVASKAGKSEKPVTQKPKSSLEGGLFGPGWSPPPHVQKLLDTKQQQQPKGVELLYLKNVPFEPVKPKATSSKPIVQGQPLSSIPKVPIVPTKKAPGQSALIQELTAPAGKPRPTWGNDPAKTVKPPPKGMGASAATRGRGGLTRPIRAARSPSFSHVINTHTSGVTSKKGPADERVSNVKAQPGAKKAEDDLEAIPGSNGWPDLQYVLQAYFRAYIAHHVLRQRGMSKPGEDRRWVKDEKEIPGYPVPIHGSRRINEYGVAIL
ncbi:uncharacterized protein F4822DRAFT_36281 [Hypoxylon trugodes]|uniref:uncharacterized protein n=1 Tax=Hypoxylon trugodes TaxID=326681 RepID=UPI002194B9BF|nr:uncharacterized protein F4822DRAFT_36281 [Hypoxylon trugodes]KAI1394081.1 hypothetical protein F4822DRAFT_36281 [Hypoxylon trugodes]